MATDAFGRLRTSDVFNLFEYHPSAASANDDDQDTWVQDVSGGTIAHDSAANVFDLTVDSGSEHAIRTTKAPMAYQPGKSRLMMFSCVPIERASTGNDDVTVRFGILSLLGSGEPDQGHWLETDGTTINFVYKYTGQSATVVAQSSWNIDIFNGSGASGKTVTIDTADTVKLTSAVLLVIDQEWLGVGRVRMGFNLNGVTYYGHEFNMTGYYPYTTTARLPLTYMVTSGAAHDTAFTIKQVCCTCISEGGYTPLGRRIAVNTGIAGVNLQSSPTNKYVVMAISLQSGYPTGTLNVLQFDTCFPSGGASNWVVFELQLHSTNGTTVGVVSGDITTGAANETGSIFKVFRGADTGANPTITTDGYVLHTECVLGKSSITISESDYATQLKRVQVTQYDTLIVAATLASGSNQNVLAGVDLLELS